MEKKKILIIDDDPLILKSFEKLFRKEGFESISVSSYEKAVLAIQGTNFDLILSDIRMPGKNGVETVSVIQKELTVAGKKDLPIIFVTGYAEASNKLGAAFYGEILEKPVDANKLLITIREYL